MVAWYVAVGWTLARAVWPGPVNGAAWLLAPAVAAFPLANLLDWPWALTGTGVLWAVAVGGLLAGPARSRRAPGAPRCAPGGAEASAARVLRRRALGRATATATAAATGEPAATAEEPGETAGRRG